MLPVWERLHRGFLTPHSAPSPCPFGKINSPFGSCRGATTNVISVAESRTITAAAKPLSSPRCQPSRDLLEYQRREPVTSILARLRAFRQGPRRSDRFDDRTELLRGRDVIGAQEILDTLLAIPDGVVCLR